MAMTKRDYEVLALWAGRTDPAAGGLIESLADALWQHDATARFDRERFIQRAREVKRSGQ